MLKLSFLFPILLFSVFSTIAQSWTKLGSGSNAMNHFGYDVYTMCTDPAGNLYTAGEIADSNGQIVAKWDGITWSTVGHLNANGQVNIVLPDNSGNIYAAGAFKNSAGYCYVAKWDGTSWSEVGAGSFAPLNANSDIETMAFDSHGFLYVAGAFKNAAGNYYVAKWDGFTWTQVGAGASAWYPNANFNTLYIDASDNIYAAGAFTDGASRSEGNLYVEKWNGSNWSEVGTGVCPQEYADNQIFYLAGDNIGNVYASGQLVDTTAYGEQSWIAHWNGTTWSALGYSDTAILHPYSGGNLLVDATGNLYAIGAADTSTTEHEDILKWNGTGWTTVGDELTINSGANVICMDGSGVIYVAGSFTDTTFAFHHGGDYLTYPNIVLAYHIPTAIMPLTASSGVTVYPNPAHSAICIDVMNAQAAKDYTIADATGKICMAGKLSGPHNILDISTLPAGMYVLQTAGGGAYKMVKE